MLPYRGILAVGEEGARLRSSRILGVLAGVGVAQMFTMVVNIVRTKLLAVLLGPTGVGVTSVVDQITQLVLQVSALSLPFASIKFLARAHSRGEATFRKTYSGLLGAVLGLTAVGTGLAIVALSGWPELVMPSVAAYAPLFLPALLGVPAMGLHGLFVQVLAAVREPRGSAVLTLIIAAGLTAAAYIGISLDGIRGLYWTSLVCNYLVVGGVVWYLSRRLGSTPFPDALRVTRLLDDNRDLFAFILISYATAVALPVSYGMARYAVLTSLGERAAGLLQVGLLLSGALGRLISPMNGLYLTPIVNREIPIEEKLRAAAEFQGTLMLVLGLVAMPVILFADGAIRLLFSPSFVDISPIAYLFVLAQCIAQLAGVHQALLIGLDDLKAYGALVGSAQLSFGVLAWLLAPRYGLPGVAISFVIANITVFGLTLARLSWKHGFVPSPKLLMLMGSGIVVLFAVGGFSAQGDPWDPLGIAAKVVVYALSASAILLLWHREKGGPEADHRGSGP
jgi:polysaccharide transporter, PST family